MEKNNRIFVVIEDVVCDMEGNPQVHNVFSKREDAIAYAKDRFEMFLAEGWIDEEENAEYKTESEENGMWEIYEDGRWVENHISITITETNLI